MSKAVLKLNCNDLKRRVLLRILGLTYPFWGLAAAVCIIIWSSSGTLYGGGNPVEAFLFFISPPVFLICYYMSARLLRNNLLVWKDTIKFPGVRRRKYELANLQSLEYRDESLLFAFGDKIESLELSRIGKQNALKLLAFLNKNVKGCRIEDFTRQAIENQDALPDFDPSKEQEIPYNGHFKLSAFFDICKQYERFFWTVWMGICLPVAIFLMPIVSYCPFAVLMRQMTGSSMTPQWVTQAIEWWGRLWFDTFKDLFTASGNAIGAWNAFLQSSQETCILFIVLASLAILMGLRALTKPTALVLDGKGFRLESAPFLGLILDLRFFPWKECKAVCLKSSEKKVSEDRLEFHGEGGKLAELELRGIGLLAHRQLIKQAIEHYAPHVEIDSKFLESVAAPQSQSYTELWLQSLNSPPKRDRLTPMQSGDHLQAGQYQIIETIGAGGQGVAYLARDKRLEGRSDEFVVIKEFMLPVYVDRRARQQALERFELEAKTLRSLDNPNIVQLKDHFIEDHRAYLVLERIKGKSLRKLFSHNPIRDEKQLEDLFRQMCKILEYLHGQEPPMVHRDFTPDNLILDESGILKLIDFNVARQEGAKTKMTVVGKHAYMPPEQFAGKPVSQSDIYALGASLFYCLCGVDPEPFTQSELPESSSSELARVWNGIIWKCTALSTASRFNSAREILGFFDGESAVSIKAKQADEVLS